jgi:DNA-binding CsgD family transcriptional regulator
MPFISAMPTQPADLLERARAIGFDKLMYGVDVLDGDIDPPLEVVGWGLSTDYLNQYLTRLRQDPLRRMVARGDIPVGNTPITFENRVSSLSIARHCKLSVSDMSLLKWFLSNGIRTGISFRIRMAHGRHASLNFYSPFSFGEGDLGAATQSLFMVGHQVHEYLEPNLAKAPGKQLSSREAECLEWIAFGKSNSEIAELLGLSVDTVKEHVRALFQKLQVNGRAQAVARGHVLAYLG